MRNWLKCLIGLHDWDEYGECRRNWTHVQGKYDAGVWLIYGGPWSRIARLRYLDRQRLGKEFQRQLAALGVEASLEMCEDVATNKELSEAMLDIAKLRSKTCKRR